MGAAGTLAKVVVQGESVETLEMFSLQSVSLCVCGYILYMLYMCCH